MNEFLELTPTLKVGLENPLLQRVFPAHGSAVAVIDTGYEGFLAIPQEVFHELALDQLQVERRTLVLANGYPLTAEGAYGTLRILDLSVLLNGFIETYRGLEEILVGVEALAGLRIVLDYCRRRMQLEVCR